VEEPVFEREPKTRLVLDNPTRQALEARLNSLDGVLGRKELVDVGFTEEEWHGLVI